MKYLISILFLLFAVVGAAQEQCNWVNSEYNLNELPTKIYNLSNQNIGLYGWENNDYSDIKETCYSEAVLYNCNSKEILLEWDATQNCSISQIHDTIIIKEYYFLAAGDNMNLVWMPFYIVKFYLENEKIKRDEYFLLSYNHYTERQIKSTIQTYNSTTKDKYPRNYEERLLIAYQLQWAYISGSIEAGNLLETFEKKFGPFDGAISEDFNTIYTTYQHIKKIKSEENSNE